jgi:hypothetical protein
MEQYLFITRVSKPTAQTISEGRAGTKKVKVKQSCYRPGVAQRVPGSYGSQIT